jgi:hypothetical protein
MVKAAAILGRRAGGHLEAAEFVEAAGRAELLHASILPPSRKEIAAKAQSARAFAPDDGRRLRRTSMPTQFFATALETR